MDIQTLRGLAYKKQRGEAYRCLSSCFYLPDKELFRRSRLFQNLIAAFDCVCPKAVEFAQKMDEAILQYSDQELAVEYARLFVGPFELQAPPYGSVYLDEGRRIMGDSTIAVRKMYRDSELNISNDFKEPPDHISAELEFMYYLTFKELEALESHDDDQAKFFLKNQVEFLEKFLHSWISSFSGKIRQSTENDFYRSLSRCLLEFVSSDHEYLKNNYGKFHRS